MTKKLEDRFAGQKDVVIFHLQTVFEGHETNTPERGPREAKKYKVQVPVGYDAHVDSETSSAFLEQYGTGGTPWTVIIDKNGIVRVNKITPGDVDGLARTIQKLRDERVEDDGEEDDGEEE